MVALFYGLWYYAFVMCVTRSFKEYFLEVLIERYKIVGRKKKGFETFGSDRKQKQFG